MELRPRHSRPGLRSGWSWPEAQPDGDSSAEMQMQTHNNAPQTDDKNAMATSSSHDLPKASARTTFRRTFVSSAASDASDASDAGLSIEAEVGSDSEADSEAGTEPAAQHDAQHDARQEAWQEAQRRQWEEYERFKRRHKPRTCRICLETVEPTFENVGDEEMEALAQETGAEEVGAIEALGRRIGDRVAGAMASAVPNFLRRQPRVRYVSADPADGRLFSPCRCKGTQKYVHEACLKAWRHSQPLSTRNYWKCPTCGFEYRIERLRWGQLISNRVTRALLTLLVFWLAIFLLGFVADPLIDMWMDPAGLIADTFIRDVDDDDDVLGSLHDFLQNHDAAVGAAGHNTASSWLEHYIKGFVSLGIVGVVKTFLAVSPFTWLNIRGNMGAGRRRRAAGGQARIEGFGWVYIVVGVFTFLGMAWKGIGYLCSRVLERASERVIDVQGGDDNDNEEEDDEDGEDDEDDEDAGHRDGADL